MVKVDWRATLLEALNAPGSLGDTYCRFYRYSYLNQILLLSQGVKEPVATYRRWAALGRQVRKGTKAKWILRPMMASRDAKDDAGDAIVGSDGERVKQQVLLGFKWSRSIFGYSDTDGDELPHVTLPGWDVETALRELGVEQVRFAKLDGNVQGYGHVGENRIAINPTAVYPVKTLFHELGHVVCGHTEIDRESVHYGVNEVEAEAVAYLAAKELELVDWNPAESRAYIQSWLGPADDTGLDDASIQRIFAATNKILTAGAVAATREEAIPA